MTTRRRRLATQLCRFSKTAIRCAAALGIFLIGSLFFASEAKAQATTFSLDRLRIGGAPDDGVAVWRPEMGERARFFGQLDLGFAYDPFRIADHIQVSKLDAARLAGVSGAPVQTQFTGYADIGVELLNRLSFQVMFPFTFVETGHQTSNPAVASSNQTPPVTLATAAPGDLRFDLRGVILRSKDRKFKLGADAFLFAPSGNEHSFNGDKGPSGGFGLAGEIDLKKAFFVLDTGFHFRPHAQLNDFNVSHEWTWGFGAFLPLRDNRVRLGLELFGSTGIGNDGSAFHDVNTPLEWMAEARFAVDKKKRLYMGGNGGTRLTPGYAPDFRLGALIGYWFNVSDNEPKAPPKKFVAVDNGSVDTDHDGYPDDIDLCPTEPEDGKPPFTTDGCPAPPDRDGDGIPDSKDKCPDVPEDKDGIQDYDGCPEDDADKDGVPDAEDKCPREPGLPNKDPAKNGCPQFIRRISGSDEIQILQQVQFEFGKATIKANSFPILDEVWKLLEANPEITLLAIEGHTDDRGSDELNLRLSKDRAHSCLEYLEKKGIASSRLTSDGFGKTRPIDTNETDEGRQKNRRVEFHIKAQTGGPAVQEQQQPGPSGPKTPPAGGGGKPGGGDSVPDSEYSTP